MLVHVRYDEIALKGGKRAWYERRLRRSLAAQCGLERRQVERREGRVALHLRDGEDDPGRVLDGVRRTFGAVSASVVHVVPRTTPDEELARAAALCVDVAREAARAGRRTFKVLCRRADPAYPLGSMPVAARLGAAVRAAVPALAVDLDAPELLLPVELRAEGVYVVADGVAGPGGYPVGTSGRALALLSGGIDSPAAAWFALKRGLAVDAVYFHAPPFTGEQAKEKVLALARALGRWSPAPLRVLVVPLTAVQEAIREGLGPREELRVLLLRRAMYRLAGAIAAARGHAALVTGEALGQVASQTPENLRCVEAVVPDALVLRPLIGLDKREIVDLARRIGTYDVSVRPHQDCCALFAPRRPATHASPARCRAAEAEVDRVAAGGLAALEAAALRGVEVWRGALGGPLVRLDEPYDAWVREDADGVDEVEEADGVDGVDAVDGADGVDAADDAPAPLAAAPAGTPPGPPPGAP